MTFGLVLYQSCWVIQFLLKKSSYIIDAIARIFHQHLSQVVLVCHIKYSIGTCLFIIAW